MPWYIVRLYWILVHESGTLAKSCQCDPRNKELDGRYLDNRWRNSESDCGRLLAPMPATQWDKVSLCHIAAHEPTNLSVSSLTKVRRA